MPDPAFTIHVRVRTPQQLFNSFDPSPFHERDLDDDAAEFISGAAREGPRDHPVVVRVQVGEVGTGDAAMLEAAIHNFYAFRATQAGRELRELLSRGRLSLAIGLAFLGACLLVVRLLSSSEAGASLWLRESVVIVGWVAMWRPLEIFLYDWWPIARERRLFQRLALARVEVVKAGTDAHA